MNGDLEFAHFLADAADTITLSRFRARDLHLVLGSTSGKSIRYVVTIDGQVPGGDAGIDVKPDGRGVVNGQRLYQLVRQKGGVRDRTFTITFVDPGAEALHLPVVPTGDAGQAGGRPGKRGSRRP